jgi:hypothetical protein
MQKPLSVILETFISPNLTSPPSPRNTLAGSVIKSYYLDISMEDVQPVELGESLYHLYENAPNLLFSHVRPFLLVLDDSVAEVSLTRIFHNDAGLSGEYHRDLVGSSMKASL